MALYISVIGVGAEDEELNKLAYEVGRLIAKAGATLVCGGMFGIMDAAARGAREAGGVAVGILPGADRGGASKHLSVAIPTGMGEGRNVLVARAADALIAIGAGYGTLSEIGLALKMGKPVVALRSWELCRPGKEGASPVKDTGLIEAKSAAEAVQAALQSIQNRW